MSNVLLQGVVLNQPIILRRTDFFEKGSRAILISRGINDDKFTFLIKNDMLANRDGFYLIDRDELKNFDKAEFKNFFEEEFEGLNVSTNRIVAKDDGSIHINKPYVMYFNYNGDYVAKWVINHSDDNIEINKEYFNDVFEDKLNNFLRSKDRNSKEIFYKNAVNIKWELDQEELEKIFADYISNITYGLRTFEEQLTHEYVSLNKLNSSIIRRFNFRDELARENMPYEDLQTGFMFKVVDDVEIENGKKLKKGDFYQVVKKWNDDYYLELLNISHIDNNDSRAIVFKCDKAKIKDHLRNVLAVEKESLYHNEVVKGMEIGEEVEFSFNILKKSKDMPNIKIEKGSKGVVIESDYKIRLAIKNNEDIIYRDFYRTEIMKTTEYKGKIREWMVTPKRINMGQNNIWNKDKHSLGAKLYHNGRFVAEIDSNNRLNFHNEMIEVEYDKLKNNILSEVSKDLEKLKVKEKEIDLIVIGFLISLPEENEKISPEYLNNNIKKLRETKGFKI